MTTNSILDPSERISEIFYGLIMVLTVIGALHVAQGRNVDAHTIIIAALGCNLAWGAIDGVTYVAGRLTERGHDHVLIRSARNAADPAAARKVIAESLPSPVAAQLPEKDLEVVRLGLMQLAEPPPDPAPTAEDWLGGFYIFLLAFVSTFPVVIPYMVIKDEVLATRVSQGVTLILLYLSGYGLGAYAGYRPWKVALAVTVIGLAMVALAVSLGG
jgi:hypothetical protein